MSYRHKKLASIPSLPGMNIGVLETNGHQNYKRWNSQNLRTLSRTGVIKAKYGMQTTVFKTLFLRKVAENGHFSCFPSKGFYNTNYCKYDNNYIQEPSNYWDERNNKIWRHA